MGSNAKNKFAKIGKKIIPVGLGGPGMRCAKEDETTFIELNPVEFSRLRTQSPHCFTSYESSLDSY